MNCVDLWVRKLLRSSRTVFNLITKSPIAFFSDRPMAIGPRHSLFLNCRKRRGRESKQLHKSRRTDRDDRGPTNLGLVQLATSSRISHAGRQFLIHLGLGRACRLVWKEIKQYEHRKVPCDTRATSCFCA